MRILIIEDEKRVAQFLRKGFSAEGFVVDIASDGERGSWLARTERYDAIILDLMLPRMGGIEVLRSIRQAKVSTPILILSAKSDLEDRLDGLNAGADDYLPKPFAFSEALARVRALVRRTSGSELGSILSVGDLEMDLLRRRVSRAGQEIPLTTKEFEVLEYLLRNKGRVISRVILTEHVWDMNFDSETNIVDVVINRLRRKIDDPFSEKLIHTVRGAGYMMKES
ncbi:MAG: DNA-binding response regulator [Bacteroidia bacterium]|nr:MAG: DNA-binding response regulator [Bacteroidia bacterium]